MDAHLAAHSPAGEIRAFKGVADSVSAANIELDSEQAPVSLTGACEADETA